MQATKAAFCLGGMHPHCFSHGLSALFQSAPYQFARDATAFLDGDELRRQEAHTPTCTPGRRGTARPRDQMRLVGTREGARLGGAGRAGAQGRIPPVEHKQAAYARDGGTVNLQGVGDGEILPCWTIRPFVGFEQDAGMGEFAPSLAGTPYQPQPAQDGVPVDVQAPTERSRCEDPRIVGVPDPRFDACERGTTPVVGETKEATLLVFIHRAILR